MTSHLRVTSLSPVYPPVLTLVVYVQRGAARLFSIVCGNTESSPNPQYCVSGMGMKAQRAPTGP